MRKIAAAFMKFGIRQKGRPMLRRLNDASMNAEKAQQAVLSDILRYAQNTVYGKQHEFSSIKNGQDFIKAVPVNTYEELRPYVERHERGESGVLFPGAPMFYATTSGTTAAPKRIPITRKYHDECYNGLTNLWLYNMFQNNPGFMNGYDISMVGKAIEGYTEDGTSYGSFSGHMNAYMPEIIKRFRVIPFEIHDIDHYPSKYYALLRVALSYPIRWIVSANPSTLLEMHRFATRNYNRITKDIFDGTLSDDLKITSSIRQKIESRLKPNPPRARFLEQLQSIHKEQLRPKHYWPSLQIINTWKSGNAALYLKQTEDFYPDTTVVREFGYLATEARAGIVLDNDSETSILAGHLLYFEFVPKEELNSRHPTFLQLHQIENGKEYGIYITTPSGLYRYNMNDIVRVEGFYNQFPQIRFIQKGSGVTSLTGEKLYESQYLDAMNRSLKETQLRASFHAAFADLKESTYHVFIEPEANQVEDNRSSQKLSALAHQLDKNLQLINPEYAAKRGSNRLNMPTINQLPQGAFIQYKSARLEQGDREGQFKMTHLQQNDEHFNMFQKLCKAPNITPRAYVEESV